MDALEAGTVHRPRRDVAHTGPGTLQADAVDHDSQRVAEHTERILVASAFVGIVVAGNDEHDVGLGQELRIAHRHGGSEALPGAVEGHAAAVAPDILIGIPVAHSPLGVPGLLFRSTMVGHIGVAENRKGLPPEQEAGEQINGGEECLFHLFAGKVKRKISNIPLFSYFCHKK